MAYNNTDNTSLGERGRAEFDRPISAEEYDELSPQDRREYDDWMDENKKKEVSVESEEDRQQRLEKELLTRDETKDQTVRDSEWDAEKKKRIEEYKKLVKKRQAAGVKLSPSDFADEFFFYFETSKSHDDRQKQAAEKTQEYERKKAQTDSKWAKKVSEFYERYINQFLKGDVFWYEKAISGFLDKKVEEIKGAYMTGSDKMIAFDYACKVKNEFEAQAYMQALCAGGDITESLIEKYLKTFGKKGDGVGGRVRMPVYDGNKTNSQAKDDDGELMWRYGYIGTIGDMWIEDKVRKEALKGGRGDAYHTGRNTMLYEDGIPVGVGFKSKEMRAKWADIDLTGNTGRRNEVALETHLYNTLWSPDDMEKTRLLLEKLNEFDVPDRIRSLDSKYQSTLAEIKMHRGTLQDMKETDIIDDREKQRGVDAKLAELQQKAKQFEKKLEDEKKRKTAIEHRLERGFNSGQLKSLLLDPDGHDVCIDYKGEKVFEYELAAELGVRKYWQWRGKGDVRRIIDGEHIKGIERMIFEQLMSDDHREEFRWSSQHHRLGSRRQEIYDPERDGAKQLWEYLNERATTRQFAVKTRKFEVIEYQEPGSKKKENRVVAYDEEGKGHLLGHSQINPNDEEALWNFYVPGSNDEAGYRRLREAPLVNLGKVEDFSLKNDLSDFAEALSDGKEEVQKTLEEEDDKTFVNGEQKAEQAKQEFAEYRKALKKYLPRPNWNVVEEGREGRKELSDEDMKKLEDIIQEMIDDDGVEETKEKLEEDAVIAEIAIKLRLTENEQLEGLKQAIYVFRERTLARFLRGVENIDWIKEELALAREIANLRLEGESDDNFVQRLKYRRGKIDDFKRDIPDEDFVDPLKKPTPEQKRKIENFVDGLAVKTLWQLMEELGKQAIAIDLALVSITGGKRGRTNENQPAGGARGGRTRRGRRT